MTIMTSPNSFSSYVFSAWRKSILQQLNERETQEVRPFENLIQHCNKLFESSNALPSEYLHSYSKYNNQINTEHSSGQSNATHQFICDKCPAIEKKLFAHQEELTIVHRKKDELQTKIIILTDQIANKEKDKNLISSELTETKKDLHDARIQVQKCEQQIIELKNQHQLLNDEYESLKLVYNSLNKKHVLLDQEHKDIVNRVMINKAKDAELLNLENEKILRLREMLKRKELEIAAREMRLSTDDKQTADNLASCFQADPTFILAKIPEHVQFQQEIHDGEVNALKWITGLEKFRKNDVLATGGGDRKVKLWTINKTSSTLLDTFTNSNAAISSIDVDGEYLLASSSDFASRLWTINDSRLRRTFTGHSSKVSCVKFLGLPSKSGKFTNRELYI